MDPNIMQLLPMLAAMAGKGGGQMAPPPAPIIAPRPTQPAVDLAPPPMPAGPSVADMGSLMTPEMQAVADTPDSGLRRGAFDRIGDFLQSDEGRAIMMRFAAGAARDGLAGGLGDATAFADQRRARAEEREDKGLDRAIRSRAVDQDYELGGERNDLARRGQDIGYDADMTREEGVNRRYGAPSGSDVLRERGAMARHSTPSGGDRLSYDLGNKRIGLDRYQWDTPSGNAQLNERGANYRHTTPSGDARLGIGSKQYGKRVEKYLEDIPGTGGWFSSPEQKEISIETPVSEIQPGQPEVRYDGAGQAYIRGPDGQPVRAPEHDRR